jgi:hypothetical protein
MKKIIFLLIILITVLTLGCTGPIEKPASTGETCNSEECFTNNFESCIVSHGDLTPDANTQIYYQIIGPKENNCEIYLELNKAEQLPEMLKGLNAKCIVNFDEMMQLQTELNIEDLNCQGPLYDTIKQIKQFETAQQN